MPVVTRDAFGLRTSDPRSQTFDRHTPRQTRLLVVSFNGTLAGGLWSPRETVVPAFAKLISVRENVFPIPLHGVGTDGSWSDFIKGGIAGWGTLRNVINAFNNLSSSYWPGDRIILIGYSRGAWAARLLAELISRIGLPKRGNEKLYKDLFKACDNKTIWQDGVADKLMDKYDSWPDVRINALCCFDTVGSLGLPLTGFAKPLRLLRGCRKKHDIISDVASNVDFAFHALSLNEEREPFAPTLMRGPNVIQVAFPGCHGDLGWVEDTEGLVHAPLAWMAQQVHTHLHIELDEIEMGNRFQNHRPEGATEPTALPTWYKGKVERLNPLALALMGKKARKPGRVETSRADGLTDLKVHIGASLRNYGAVEGTDAVPGYTVTVPTTGTPYWVRKEAKSKWSWPSRCNSGSSKTSSSSDGSLPTQKSMTRSLSKTADRIEQAEVGSLEARCLGLPLSYVMAPS